MGFFNNIQRKLNMENPQQVKQECKWLWAKMKKHFRSILAVGAFTFLGTVMGLASSIASKYLIDAVTGHGTDKIAISSFDRGGYSTLHFIETSVYGFPNSHSDGYFAFFGFCSEKSLEETFATERRAFV